MRGTPSEWKILKSRETLVYSIDWVNRRRNIATSICLGVGAHLSFTSHTTQACSLNHLTDHNNFFLRILGTFSYRSPRKAHCKRGKTSTSAVLGQSTFTNPRGEPPSAPASGSMMSSGQIAPRMKLVRRASRDLSADVQARAASGILPFRDR